VSELATAAERFADGRPVLVGDPLGLADSIARRPELADVIPEGRQKLDLSLTTPIDAAWAPVCCGAVGASTIRLSAPARWRADALRACGLDVQP
jgi:hypothetical protein